MFKKREVVAAVKGIVVYIHANHKYETNASQPSPYAPRVKKSAFVLFPCFVISSRPLCCLSQQPANSLASSLDTLGLLGVYNKNSHTAQRINRKRSLDIANVPRESEKKEELFLIPAQ
jgi:hypothetical protein